MQVFELLRKEAFHVICTTQPRNNKRPLALRAGNVQNVRNLELFFQQLFVVGCLGGAEVQVIPQLREHGAGN